VIYGGNANSQLAETYKEGIVNAWGKDSNNQPWQMQINGESYSTEFEVNISVGKDPGSLKRLWNTFGGGGTENYINVDEPLRSYVGFGGATGSWRAHGRGGVDIKYDNPAPHEIGHLLGLRDRYNERTQLPDPGWENNIMGDSKNGRVGLKNINALGY
jgi:hypothetical protein